MDVSFDPESVPIEFRGLRQFVNWKGSKVPKQSRAPHKNAAVNNPGTWATFDEAVTVGKSQGMGLGFVFTEQNPFAFIDLDWKVTGAASPLQNQIIEQLQSYTECSPSGLGAHVFVQIDKARIHRGKKVHTLGVEVYLNGQYSTLTGRMVLGLPQVINERTDALLDILNKVSEAKIAEGGRNNALTSRAGQLRHSGLNVEQLGNELTSFNDQFCNPPLPPSEVLDIASRVANYDVSGFLALPRWLLHSRIYAELSLNARSLLVDIAASFTGKNNGRLTAVYEHMRWRGWRSPKVFYTAVKELLDAGLLVRTVRAGSHRPARYKIPALNPPNPP